MNIFEISPVSCHPPIMSPSNSNQSLSLSTQTFFTPKRLQKIPITPIFTFSATQTKETIKSIILFVYHTCYTHKQILQIRYSKKTPPTMDH